MVHTPMDLATDQGRELVPVIPRAILLHGFLRVGEGGGISPPPGCVV